MRVAEAALALETRRLGADHPALAGIHEQLGELELLAGEAHAAARREVEAWLRR